jgi:predicted dehydrogenase
MSDNINSTKILLVGAGPMAMDYMKVLSALNADVTVVGRSEKTTREFEAKTGHVAVAGGLNLFLEQHLASEYSAVIIAVGVEQLATTTLLLLEKGFLKIMVEKPAGMNSAEIQQLALLAKQKNADVLVAYNRRFYASVIKAQEIIEADGGVTSFNFEFTEWAHVIEPLTKAAGVKEKWLLANSTHVIDLAFFLGGNPVKISSYAAGELNWHDRSIFSGAGISDKGALFSYQANWEAPGRWVVEVLTAKSRLIFKPMEELQVQLKGSVAINKVELFNELDIVYKPGLYTQTSLFLQGKYDKLKTIGEQAKISLIYDQIATGN